jgi:hypothetical protein
MKIPVIVGSAVAYVLSLVAISVSSGLEQTLAVLLGFGFTCTGLGGLSLALLDVLKGMRLVTPTPRPNSVLRLRAARAARHS